MTRIYQIIAIITISTLLVGCPPPQSSNDIQRQQSEVMLQEATSQVGMPAIKNFRERKIMRDILELRDQEGLVTFTYLENVTPAVVPGKTALGGKLTFLSETVGYGIPYATQFTAPSAVQRFFLPSVNGSERVWGQEVLPQADPNGLFAPSSAEGTWVMMKDPNSPKVGAQYIEPKIAVFTFRLPLD